MKGWYRFLVMSSCLILTAFWWRSGTSEPTLLSFRPGQSFEGVVKDSTFPVLARSNIPDADSGWGATWVTEPAVIIRLNDSKHGFTLPPTKFAALSYQRNVVATLATSPMLDALPFEAVAVLDNLQNQFKAGGWEPWEKNDSVWFDLSPEGRKRLYARMFEPGYAQEATLRIPKLYGMTFRLKCNEGCWTREPPYLFLIDIGLSDDVFGWMPGNAEGPQAAAMSGSVK
ncbi:hypothetical protein [Massilia litorea]|uniref:Uncharacterized protein n=1 Tax=Massilia litorea TaxID=2769491 RepID=A0A7L9U9C9_9BURK|nr:hypothetical protein [Massilia litorea]QOL51497.1 hypothetical protein LPB04_09705 [Massilia litorea]